MDQQDAVDTLPQNVGFLRAAAESTERSGERVPPHRNVSPVRPLAVTSDMHALKRARGIPRENHFFPHHNNRL
jgi:hypothetical protein